MKETKVKRQVKPRSGRGKPREGLFTKHRSIPENQADLAEIAKSTAPTYDPVSRLERLLKSTEEVLKNLPSFDQKYQILEDGSWQELSDDETQYQQGVDSTSPLAEPVSPEYFALQVRRWATVALQRLNSGDYQGAILPIMNAHEAHWKMVFAEQWEYPLTAKIASDKGRNDSDRSNEWALPLARYLRNASQKGEKKPAFKVAIRHLELGDQPTLHAGLRVYFDDVDERLDAYEPKTGKTRGTISMETFRTDYYKNV